MIGRRVTISIYLLTFILMCDQLSKWWVVTSIMRPEPRIVPMNGILNFVLVWNKGVTFGLLNRFAHDYLPWILIGAAFVVLFLLTRWLLRTSSMLIALSLGSIMGGAIGNILDRLRYGAVVDFLDFHIGDYHWYAFNFADAAIVTGVVLLIMDSLVKGR